jgi:hypothetical protein
MSVPVVVNNENFNIPQNFGVGWGDIMTAWIVAISASTLQLSGGNFALTADVNFGTAFGLIAEYYKSNSSNIAQSGEIRLANGDDIAWRNANNTGDIYLTVDSNNSLNFNGNDLIDTNSEQILENKDILVPPELITTSTYTLQLTDAFSKFLLFNSISSQTCIIPNDSNIDFDVGTEIPISQNGTGQTQVVASAGVTFNNPYASNLLRQQYSSASLVKTAANTWQIVGDIYNG